MKNKYGEGNVSEEICPKCCNKFKCLSAGIYEDETGMIQYYADDCHACYVCSNRRNGTCTKRNIFNGAFNDI